MDSAKTAHPIKIVAKRTGLSPHVIRAWERRYNAVTPVRSGTNRRLYCEEDIARLALLARLTRAGHSIGHIASLPKEELERLAAEDEGSLAGPPAAERIPAPTDIVGTEAGELADECFAALRGLEELRLRAVLDRAQIVLSLPQLLEQFLGRVLEQAGEFWREGTIRVSHEHLLSSCVRSFLGRLLDARRPRDGAPCILLTTPAGQLHELGSMMAAVAAAEEGWRAVYLGPNLPATEIAMVGERLQARAVGLSIVYPSDDPLLEQELAMLRRALSDEVSIYAGGRCVDAYTAVLNRVGAKRFPALSAFRHELALRRFAG